MLPTTLDLGAPTTCFAPASASRSMPATRWCGSPAWAEFEARFGELYHPHLGRPGLPTRLMVGLSYVWHAFGL
jgi:hypothetical protein